MVIKKKNFNFFFALGTYSKNNNRDKTFILHIIGLDEEVQKS